MLLMVISFAVKFLLIYAYKDCIVPYISNGYVHEITIHNEYIPLESGLELPHGTEILVTCAEGYDLTANQLVEENFALKCDNGNYPMVPSCVFVEMKAGRLPGRRRGRLDKYRRQKLCPYEPRDEVLLAYVDGIQINANSTFPDGTNMTFRCVDISTFAFFGNVSRACENGKWQGRIPHCVRLYPYSFYSAPVIAFDISSEQLSITQNGTLMIPDNTNVTLHCLWLRDNSEPNWKKDGKSIDKKVIPSKTFWNKRENSYQLLIPNIKENASGYYSCFTPNRKRHGINIIIFHQAKPSEEISVIEENENETTSLPLSCIFDPSQSLHTKVFQNGQLISRSEEPQEFPNNTTLNIICENVLHYKLEGNKLISCEKNQWTSPLPNCTRLMDSPDSAPPLDIQLSGTDKTYFVNDQGTVVVPKDTTITFICKYSSSKPIMSLFGTRLRFSTGQHRAGGAPVWYLRLDIPSTPVRFTFVCKAPRKDSDLFHSLDVISKNTCVLEERKLQMKWRGSKIISVPGRHVYAEDDTVAVGCDDVTTSVIPSYFRCGDKGNWIPGPNQRCRAR